MSTLGSIWCSRTHGISLGPFKLSTWQPFKLSSVCSLASFNLLNFRLSVPSTRPQTRVFGLSHLLVQSLKLWCKGPRYECGVSVTQKSQPLPKAVRCSLYISTWQHCLTCSSSLTHPFILQNEFWWALTCAYYCFSFWGYRSEPDRCGLMKSMFLTIRGNSSNYFFVLEQRDDRS